MHGKFNEREMNPNPHINFVSALPAPDPTEQESARQLLRALAAQVRPIMKSHGFSISSLEEYDHNNVFAGRNWNAGETVELVLRRADRTFLPTFWLLSTLCHELAHIKHMNHGPAFQALWRKLNAELHSLQNKGYFGDGYWSSGTRLADSSKVAGEGIGAGDLPEYMCGGAHNRTRSASVRRRPRKLRNTAAASNNTGRQTAKRRKAGARVTSKNAFVGQGTVLVEGDGEGKGKGKGTGFGKQATSKRAREERALAAEQRMRALQTQLVASTSYVASEGESVSDSDEEKEIPIHETDSDRRQTLLSSEQSDDLQGLKSGILWNFFRQDFISGGQDASHVNESPDDHDTGYSGTSASGPSTSKGKRKHESEESYESLRAKRVVRSPAASLGIGKLVQSEIDFRKRESLGMTSVKGGGRTLGSSGTGPSHNVAKGICTLTPSPEQWACLVCTLRNDAEHLACSACATPRGD